MKVYQQNEKDISNVFNYVRAQLQAKEKQLLELQRADPCLLAPDCEQIDVIIDAISALQLSTPDGSFVFASASDCDAIPPYISVCSAGFNAIKALPPAVWLSSSNPVKQQNQQGSSMFSHLLSLPIHAYLASSWSSTFETPTATQDQVIDCISMVNQLLHMPINVFKPSSTTSTPIQIKNNKNLQNNELSTSKGTANSLVTTGAIFSKELWLQNGDLPTTEETPKSLVTTGSSFSKEFWLENDDLLTAEETSKSLVTAASSFSKELWLQNDDLPTTEETPKSLVTTGSSFSKELWLQNDDLPTTEEIPKSLVTTGSSFSKEFWLQNDNLPTTKETSKSLVGAGMFFSKELWLQNN